MKIYIVKNALTQGILEVDAEVRENKYAFYKKQGSIISAGLKGKDWVENLDEAYYLAERQRDKKILLLNKAIDRIQKKKICLISN